VYWGGKTVELTAPLTVELLVAKMEHSKADDLVAH
jgi:hypothetical protein